LLHVVHVAVGVIIGKDGAILLAKRPNKTHQGGLWEFPGGKVEQGETLFDALKRELQEELAINITSSEPLIKIRHDYGDKVVLLDVHKVNEFSGEPKGNEGQPVLWVAANKLHDYEFPAANRPIITAINLPSRFLVSGAFNNLKDFSSHLEYALERGIKLVQLRVSEAELTPEFVQCAVDLCNSYSAKLLINTTVECFEKMALQGNHVGLHLNSKNLLACSARPVCSSVLLSASCHNQIEIEHAQTIGVDFMCVSPVLETLSHPGQRGMGWQAFEALVEHATIPVYALGGMQESDLAVAIKCGAQGIAAISAWW
jgi:8-oxo-dGTP diphosphatase